MKKISVILTVLILLFLSMGIAQADPTNISATCIVQGDKAALAYERAKCDDAAEFAGYQNGFLRPCNPSDGNCDYIILCALPVENKTVYMCFGVPWN